MSVPVRALDRYYPTDPDAGYVTRSVSADAVDALRAANDEARKEETPTVRNAQPRLLSDVWTISHVAEHDDWDGDCGKAISRETTAAAVKLICALPEGLQPPEVAGEPTGEIAFEWYRNRRFVAVVTVQDNIIRWSAVVGADGPRYGREYFKGTIPGAALTDIQLVIG